MKDLERRKDLKDRYVAQTWYRDKRHREDGKRSCYATVTIHENSVTSYPGNCYEFGIVSCFEI